MFHTLIPHAPPMPIARLSLHGIARLIARPCNHQESKILHGAEKTPLGVSFFRLSRAIIYLAFRPDSKPCNEPTIQTSKP